MRNKKIMSIFGVLLIIVIIGGYFGIQYVKERKKETSVEEYIPQEEITQEQLRQTIVSLYFPSKDENELLPEARLVDIKDVINNPYDKLVVLLIEGPKSDKLKKIIPENTKVLKTYIENDCVTIDLSNEFLNFNKDDETEKNNLINSIVKTLTELTEVNKVKILIDGSENDNFKEIYIRQK